MGVVATGATLTFAAGLAGEIYDMAVHASRPAIPVSHMGSTGGEAFLPGKLVRWTMDVVCAYTGQPIPMASTDVAVSIAVATADSQGWSGTAFITDASVSTPLEGRQELRMTLQGSGALTWV
jgi:hypothetical protein